MATKIFLGENMITPEGGFAKRMINKTGVASVKGTLVIASTGTNYAFEISPVSAPNVVGVVYESGIADGSYCWVVTNGPAQVLLKNTTGSTKGHWVRTADVAGRCITAAAPPGGGISEIDQHLCEIGHCMETVTSGTDKLCLVMTHYN